MCDPAWAQVRVDRNHEYSTFQFSKSFILFGLWRCTSAQRFLRFFFEFVVVLGLVVVEFILLVVFKFLYLKFLLVYLEI